MPSRSKKWVHADEDESHKTFRYEDEETPEIWFDKTSGHYTKVRNHLNTPGKWSRLPEPIKNYQIVKRIALETLMRRILRSQRVA